MSQAQKKQLFRAFSAALKCACEWGKDGSEEVFNAEEQPEFQAVLALLDQGAGQALANIPGALEQWIEGISWDSSCLATDDEGSDIESDNYDFMAYALCKAMVERGVELRKPADWTVVDWDFLQTKGTDLAPIIAKQQALQLEKVFPEPTKSKSSVPRM